MWEEHDGTHLCEAPYERTHKHTRRSNVSGVAQQVEKTN